MGDRCDECNGELQFSGLDERGGEEMDCPLCKARAEIERLRKALALLHDATIVLRNGMGGHGHWDHTMQHGAGCEVCLEQRAARDEATRLIEAASAAGEE